MCQEFATHQPLAIRDHPERSRDKKKKEEETKRQKKGNSIHIFYFNSVGKSKILYKIPILFCKILYEIGHYFLDIQYTNRIKGHFRGICQKTYLKYFPENLLNSLTLFKIV